uniref:Uncharacterized protein n=1 Tax=Tanacetum cinerariifolium TaxID=118510 RepID=A0A6L2M3Q0_TANCI|nr:hypothetical protein [Tanacetum cinerariifolium]
MIINKDSEILKAKGERKYLALKAKKESSDEGRSSFESEDEEYAVAVRDFKKFFKRRGSDEEDDEKAKDETCFMAHVSSEICLGVDLEPDKWIKDSRCSKHMTCNRQLFSTYKAYNGDNVVFGSNLHGNIIGKGQICENKCKVIFSEHDSEITKDGKVIEPKNVNEALKDESWIIAMTIIRTKWVYRNKLDENGVVSRNKARLVNQGYNQQEGIDYDEINAPIAREDLEALWSLVNERFSTAKPKNFSDDFLLTTLGALFEKPDAYA